MGRREDPVRWSEGGGAPEGFSALLRGDDAAPPDAAQLARVLDRVARQVARPELSQALRSELSAGAGAAGGPAPRCSASSRSASRWSRSGSARGS